MITLGGDEHEAETSLADLRASPDLLDAETHRLWNEYLASVPLVAPADAVRFTIPTLNKEESIAPEELVRSELWFWRGLLNTTCQVSYLPACPMMIADWNDFMGMWSNDGIAEAVAMAGTNRRDLARGFHPQLVPLRGERQRRWHVSLDDFSVGEEYISGDRS